jgi:type II secretory pathway predicted ATPase ExeA
MIQSHFNLKRLPFAKDLKPADLLDSEPRRELLARLEHLRKHHGLFLLTGAPGTGKNAALRVWIHSLPETNHKIVYMPLSTISPWDLLQHLNDAFAGQPAFRKAKVFVNLQAAIRDWIDSSRRLPILIFDEAHCLP